MLIGSLSPPGGTAVMKPMILEGLLPEDFSPSSRQTHLASGGGSWYSPLGRVLQKEKKTQYRDGWAGSLLRLRLGKMRLGPGSSFLWKTASLVQSRPPN